MCGQSVEEGGVSAEQLVQGAYPRACGGGRTNEGWDGNAFQKSIARRGVACTIAPHLLREQSYHLSRMRHMA